MIHQITIENFFSYGNATTITLNSGTNVLVGINGSGKSNFLKALRILEIGATKQDLNHLIGEEWGGWEAVLHSGAAMDESIQLIYVFKSYDGVELKYTLTLSKRGKEFREVLDYKAEELSFTFLDITSNIKTREATGYIVKNSEDQYVKEPLDEESLRLGELYVSQLATTSMHVRNFLDYVRTMHYYNHFDVSPRSNIRLSNRHSVDEYLSNIGTNLSNIIVRIRDKQPFAYKEIIQQLKKVNPQFEELLFQKMGTSNFLSIRERYMQRPIPLEHFSDGTLYFVLMLSIFYNPDRGRGLIVEELELGLHPKAIHFVAQAMQYAAEDNTQLFIVTHSPLLLNDFGLEDILIFSKNEQNFTEVHSARHYNKNNLNVLIGDIWQNNEQLLGEDNLLSS